MYREPAKDTNQYIPEIGMPFLTSYFKIKESTMGNFLKKILNPFWNFEFKNLTNKGEWALIIIFLAALFYGAWATVTYKSEINTLYATDPNNWEKVELKCNGGEGEFLKLKEKWDFKTLDGNKVEMLNTSSCLVIYQ